MLLATCVVFLVFVSMYVTAAAEVPSPDSGTNLLVTAIMFLLVGILASFSYLTTIVTQSYVRIVFGFGIFSKKFLVQDIASVSVVKNSWWYGWGIRFCLRPRMWIFNVSGFDAVEIVMRDARVFRIGTDKPKELEMMIKRVLLGDSRA